MARIPWGELAQAGAYPASALSKNPLEVLGTAGKRAYSQPWN